MQNGEFAGKVALVTGAGAGIGRSIAREWAARVGIAIVTDHTPRYLVYPV